jgi:hypothetical protein
MVPRSWRFLLALTAGLVVAGGVLCLATRSGFSARERPSLLEAFVAVGCASSEFQLERVGLLTR